MTMELIFLLFHIQNTEIEGMNTFSLSITLWIFRLLKIKHTSTVTEFYFIRMVLAMRLLIYITTLKLRLIVSHIIHLLIFKEALLMCRSLKVVALEFSVVHLLVNHRVLLQSRHLFRLLLFHLFYLPLHHPHYRQQHHLFYLLYYLQKIHLEHHL